MKNIKISYICMGILLIIQFGIILYFAVNKINYHPDEIFSYGLANSTRGPYFTSDEEYLDNWHNTSYFREYLTVQEEDKFNYNYLIENQKKDVHPPLYYVLLNTVSSLTPNIFSKWTGIGINILCCFITSIILYKMCIHIFLNRYIAILPCLLWGGSIFCINSVLFIRMYSLLTVWTVLITWNILKFLHCNKTKSRILVDIYLTIVLGFMTQYYFIIYLFFISFIFEVILFIKKRFRDVILYFTCCISAGLTGALLFPASIEHLFGSERGKGARDRLFDIFIPDSNLIAYLKILNKELLGGGDFVYIIAAGLIIAGAKILYSIIKLEVNKEMNDVHITMDFNVSRRPVIKETAGIMEILIIIVSCSLYFIIIAKISPYRVDRYIMPIIPLLSLFCVWCMVGIYKIFIPNWKFHFMFIFIMLFVLVSVNIIKINSSEGKIQSYLYSEAKEALQYAHEYKGLNAVVVYGKVKASKVNVSVMELMQYEKVYISTDNNISKMIKALQKENSKQPIIIYIDKECDDPFLVLRKIKKSTSYKSTQKIYTYGSFTIWKVS